MVSCFKKICKEKSNIKNRLNLSNLLGDRSHFRIFNEKTVAVKNTFEFLFFSFF